METIESFVLRVRSDMDSILALENAAEVLTEYRESLDLPDAILKVRDRKRIAAAMQEQVSRIQETREQEAQNRRQLIDVMRQAGDHPPEEEMYTMTFTVTGTKPDLKALKAYILSSNLTIEEDNE